MYYFYIFVVGPMIWLSALIFGLTLFRRKVNSHLKPILLTSACMTLLAHILQSNQLAYLTTTVQPIAFIFCFRYFFRFIWSHSTMMSLIIYSMNMTMEWSAHAINAILNQSNLVDTLIDDDFSLLIYIVFTNLFAATIIQQYRLGFTFVQPFKFSLRQKSSTNVIIVLLACVGAIIIVTTSISLFLFRSVPFSIYSKLILWSVMIGLMATYYYKELREE